MCLSHMTKSLHWKWSLRIRWKKFAHGELVTSIYIWKQYGKIGIFLCKFLHTQKKIFWAIFPWNYYRDWPVKQVFHQTAGEPLLNRHSTGIKGIFSQWLFWLIQEAVKTFGIYSHILTEMWVQKYCNISSTKNEICLDAELDMEDQSCRILPSFLNWGVIIKLHWDWSNPLPIDTHIAKETCY